MGVNRAIGEEVKQNRRTTQKSTATKNAKCKFRKSQTSAFSVFAKVRTPKLGSKISAPDEIAHVIMQIKLKFRVMMNHHPIRYYAGIRFT
jgi:head-tail adaptor